MRASLSGGGAGLLLATLAIAGAAALLFVAEAVYWNPSSGVEEARSFQRTVGGVGMGAAATPAWNLLYFDPRLQAVEDSNLNPVPGSCPYSPFSAAVVVFRELPRNEVRITRVTP